jgi:predicted dehydrogenase
MGPPETTIWEYPGEDHSWRTEFTHFIECIRHGRQPSGTLNDALAALEVVQHAYDQAAAPSSRHSQNGALTRGAS